MFITVLGRPDNGPYPEPDKSSSNSSYPFSKTNFNINFYKRAISWMDAGSTLHELNAFFSMYLILPAALGPGDNSASDRNEYPVHKADNLTAICEPIV
jgi:hypothetical protein